MFGELMTVNFTEPNSSTARVETPVDPLVKDQQSLNLLDSNFFLLFLVHSYIPDIQMVP